MNAMYSLAFFRIWARDGLSPYATSLSLVSGFIYSVAWIYFLLKFAIFPHSLVKKKNSDFIILAQDGEHISITVHKCELIVSTVCT
jgi:hypothetical protein